MTTARRVTLSALAAAGLVALGTVSASAHVTITPSTTAAGATAVLRVEIPHGCEESATTGLTIRMPDGVTDATATGTDRWAAEQAADSVTWTTDEPLPDGEHAEVELSVRLPDDAGATLVFPVVQQCEVGEAAWTEVAEHAEGHDELERPAPVVVVTAGDAADADADPADAAATAHAAHPADSADTEAAGATTDTGARDPLVTYGAAGLLAAGVLVGGAALLRQRRRQP
ncbi:YcnI family protein [Promicromonospora sukumoe]|uniref:Uncharacterized protein YcnI n=1 Tax=Promicromonospora sukumoe TaxID=88382 RepID=A0A7W3PG42_9MICO|nr:YcnI family protein [Promicromonospora sukumoe]MBA8810224.1 uncharacterized protein YcnI [Promicromonospora sukumoe]